MFEQSSKNNSEKQSTGTSFSGSIGIFRNTRHIHFVAIGGIGMSGIAEVLLSMGGFVISGSDLRDSGICDRLRKSGARITIGHQADNITGADVVVRSSAVTEANAEIRAARQQRIPVIRRAEMLAELMLLKQGIAIAGSHGKTSTTSLVASALLNGGLQPTVIVGGVINNIGSNAVTGPGQYLVAEADESDGTFLHLTPTVAVVTNIDYEHVDHYQDMDELRSAFREFLGRVPFYGTCVLCLDDPEVRALIPMLDRRVVTYGLTEFSDVSVDPASIVNTENGQEAQVLIQGQPAGMLSLAMRGRHNLCNALAALAVALDVGVDFDSAAEGIAQSQGVGRRCDIKGEHDGVLVIDDYGHHPTEIQATMEVALSYGRPVSVVFQPHRYSRTESFSHQFAEAMAAASQVALLPVYAASEKPIDGVDSSLIAISLNELDLHDVTLPDSQEELRHWLKTKVPAGNLLLVSGAGDIGRWVQDICDTLDERRS
ncbi:MAG: UDP-N-acetylmuramate--L-alanine ligase [bacterium]|nr:UDP-N-acetylmuramate--L-alanine ligase [bacterium]